MVAWKRDHPGNAARNRHIAFVMANWDLLAKESYVLFLQQGKGLLLVNESDFMGMPTGVQVEFGIGYITESHPGVENILGEQERSWFRTYNPETTLLVGFAREDGGMSSYRINGVGARTPKELYDRARASG